MALTAAEVFRDYVTDGVPPSGANKPRKSDIRALLKQYEQVISAFTSSGGLIYDTRALLFADLTKPANSMAWVIGDSTAAYNGVYKKVGASGAGSWTRVADLPYSFIVATDAGAGTANAIQATSSLPVSASALVVLNVFRANGAGATTVQFNGGPVYTIKTNSGNDPAPGGLLAGMIVMGYVSGSTFRIVNDQVSAAIVAQAEAAAQAAEDARDIAVAAAASVDLPVAAPGDELLYLRMKSDLTGYELAQPVPGLSFAGNGGKVPSIANDETEIRFPAYNRFANQLQTGGGAAKAYNSDLLNALCAAAAADGGGGVVIPAGTWQAAGLLMRAGVTYMGANRNASKIIDDAADTAAIFKSANREVSCLWAGIQDLFISKPNAANSCIILDMTSMQFVQVRRNWVIGKQALGVSGMAFRGLYTGVNSFYTEGTYGLIERNYIGLANIGMRFGPNANAMLVRGNRIQPSFNNGFGVYLGAVDAQPAVAGFPNQITFQDNSFEFPAGAGVTGLRGYFLEASCKDIHIIGGRVEGGAFTDAVYVTAGASGSVRNLYTEGNTGKIVNGISPAFVSYTGDDHQTTAAGLGDCCINGITGAKLGRSHNLVGARNSAGNYTFTFGTAMPDGNYKVSVSVNSSSAALVRLVKLPGSFSVITENIAGAAADVQQVMVEVNP